VKRPIIVMSIEAVETADDLADRTRSFTFSTISPRERKAEEDMWAEVERGRPRVLGALLDVAAVGLRDLNTIQPTTLSRMADGAKWMLACESALGWPPGTYAAAVSMREQEVASVVVGSTVIGLAVVEFMKQRVEKRATWQGTATKLLKALATFVSVTEQRSWRWPNSPEALGGRLRRLAPVLRRKGLKITFSRAGDRVGTRMIRIETIAADSSDRSKKENRGARAADASDGSDGKKPTLGVDEDVAAHQPTPPKVGKKPSAPYDCQQPRTARDQERDRAAAAGGGAARVHARRVAATEGRPKRKRTASSSTSTSGTGAETTGSTRAERPLWQRRPPRELTDVEAERWETARRHVDPERDEYAADHLARQQWLALLERLDEVAAHRRARSGP
jgi:hypothetical protein